MRKRFFKLPHVVFTRCLKCVDILVYVALLSLDYDGDGFICASARRIGKRCGLCKNTVLMACSRLCDAGLIGKMRRYNSLGYVTENGYLLLPQSGRFVRIPAKLLSCGLLPSQFAVYCYIKKCANHVDRAFPSYQRIMDGLHISHNTAIAAVKALEKTGLLAKRLHRRNCGAFGCNNYYLDNAAAQLLARCRILTSLITGQTLCASIRPSLATMLKPTDQSAIPLAFFFFAVLILTNVSTKQLRFLFHLWGSAKNGPQYLNPPKLPYSEKKKFSITLKRE